MVTLCSFWYSSKYINDVPIPESAREEMGGFGSWVIDSLGENGLYFERNPFTKYFIRNGQEAE